VDFIFFKFTKEYYIIVHLHDFITLIFVFQSAAVLLSKEFLQRLLK